MKRREAFERIRHQKNKLSLRVKLTLLVSAELIFSILIALGLALLLERFWIHYDSKLYLLLTLLGIALLVGVLVTGFLARLFFDPIKKLQKAMEQVADGDFSVRLETKTSSKEIREIYSGFNLMAHELAATEILQTDFVSNVSHEIKTPINAIEGYTTLLQGSDDLEPEQEQYIEKILFNTKRLSALVGNILLLSKIENQSIQTKQNVFRLDEQIRQSIVALEPAWEAKELEFDVELERVDYIGNEALFHHVWDNLIGNAVKFSPMCGLITLRLTKEGNSVIFMVEDNGPGLSEEAQKHIFDKFYQADSSHKAEGNGLGLALVKRILLLTGGNIRAENLAAGGCRFTATLPNTLN